jgi:hypothetical protein
MNHSIITQEDLNGPTHAGVPAQVVDDFVIRVRAGARPAQVAESLGYRLDEITAALEERTGASQAVLADAVASGAQALIEDALAISDGPWLDANMTPNPKYTGTADIERDKLRVATRLKIAQAAIRAGTTVRSYSGSARQTAKSIQMDGSSAAPDLVRALTKALNASRLAIARDSAVDIVTDQSRKPA